MSLPPCRLRRTKLSTWPDWMPHSRAIAAAVMLFCQNLIGLGFGPLFFGMLSQWLKPEFGTDSVRYVLFGAAWLGLIPAFFFWRCSLRLNAELDQKG